MLSLSNECRRDARAAFALRVLMAQRGLSPQGLADAMLIQGIQDAPSRETIARVLRIGAVPQARHRRAIAEFFDRDPTQIWRVAHAEIRGGRRQ